MVSSVVSDAYSLFLHVEMQCTGSNTNHIPQDISKKLLLVVSEQPHSAANLGNLNINNTALCSKNLKCHVNCSIGFSNLSMSVHIWLHR